MKSLIAIVALIVGNTCDDGVIYVDIEPILQEEDRFSILNDHDLQKDSKIFLTDEQINLNNMPKAEIPLVNFFNFQYVGTVYFGGGGGKKPEPIKVIFDTGSSWTWV